MSSVKPDPEDCSKKQFMEFLFKEVGAKLLPDLIIKSRAAKSAVPYRGLSFIP